MKLFNQSLIETALPLSSDVALTPIYAGNAYLISISLKFSGSPNGTFVLQASNDAGSPMSPGHVAQIDTVENWDDIEGSEQAVTEAGTHTWNVAEIGFMWVRAVYRRTSGTGTLTQARITVKGV